jgi:hypothetical protein
MRRRLKRFSLNPSGGLMEKSSQPLRLHLVAILVVLALGGQQGLAIDLASQWISPIDGSWTDGSKWSSNPSFPDNDPPTGTNYSAVISAAGSPYQVSLSSRIEIDGLTINSSDAVLLVAAGGTLSLSGDLQIQEGTLRIDNQGASNIGRLEFAGPGTQSLVGAGTLEMVSNNLAVHEIQIVGTLDIDDAMTVVAKPGRNAFGGNTLINNGTFRIEAGGRSALNLHRWENDGLMDVYGILELNQAFLASGSWTNDGLIRLRPGSIAVLGGDFSSAVFDNVDDLGATTVRVTGVMDNEGRTFDFGTLAGNRLSFTQGEIRGGTLISSAVGTPQVESVNGHGRLKGVTLATDLLVGPTGVSFEGGLHLGDVNVQVSQGGAFTSAESIFTTLSGKGTIDIVPHSPAGRGYVGGHHVTIGEEITIRNGGAPGSDTNIHFYENYGTLVSESVGGLLLIGNLPPAFGPPRRWRNLGTIKAVEGTVAFTGVYSVEDIGTVEMLGGSVRLGGTIENAGRVLRFADNSATWDAVGDVHGGRLETGPGVTTAIYGGNWHGVTFAGKFAVRSLSQIGPRINIYESLTLDDAEITVDERVTLRLQGPMHVTGRGSLVLNGPTTVSGPLIQHDAISGVLSLAPEVTLRTGPLGGGGVNGTGPLINFGLISAETSGKSLSINRPLENYGILQNRNQSDLYINAASWVNEGTILSLGPFRNQGFFHIQGGHFQNADSGLIAGDGMIVVPNATFINHGTIAPGLGVGALSIAGDVQLRESSVLEIELGANGTADQFRIIRSDLQLGGELKLTQLPGFTPGNLSPIPIITVSGGTIAGAFLNGDQPIRLGQYSYAIEYGTNAVFLRPSLVPEPTTWGLAMIGIAAGVAARRRYAGTKT